MISDKLGGVRVTLINFVFMALFSALIFLTLPGSAPAALSRSIWSLWGCSSPPGSAAARPSR
jgi:nitrate/nitrite transporter NarK